MADKKGEPKKAELKDETGKPIMELKVYSAFNSYFDDMAYSVSAVNHTGPFDILPRHHNFMTLIKPGEIKITAPGGDKIVPTGQALMHVKADRVVIFLDS